MDKGTHSVLQTKLARHDWLIVIAVATAGTIVCQILTVLLDMPVWWPLETESQIGSLRNDILIPLVLAPPFFALLTWKIRQLAAMQRVLEVLVSTDSMIGCLNRRAFTQKTHNLLEKAEGATRQGVAMMVIDIDHFKKVNDTAGHEMGDEALIMVAKALESGVGEDAIFGRIGGEEFGVFLPKAQKPLAVLAAERLRMMVAQLEFSPNGQIWPLSVSIGVSYAEGKISFQELYREADSCLYDAKRSGRDRVVASEIVAEHRKVA